MARRNKKNESLADALFQAPWQISVVIGVVVFIALKFVFPSIWSGNLFLKPMAQAFSQLAWLFSGFFFLIAAFVYFKSAALRSKQSSTIFRETLSGDPASAWKPPPWATHGGKGRVEPGADVSPIRRGPLGEPLGDSLAASAKKPSIVDPLSELDSLRYRREPSGNAPDKSTQWSIDLIRDIEWKRFEDVCQKFYEMKGIRSETTALGPDGGIDIRLFQDETSNATSIVQCKAWGERFVGVKPVRELLGVMTHEKIGKAFFMTSGRFSDDAKEVAKANRITLIDGEMFLMMIRRLPEDVRGGLLAFATEGDYKVPTCPTCGVKMKHVPGKAGRPDFWGCHNYPRCRQILGMRK